MDGQRLFLLVRSLLPLLTAILLSLSPVCEAVAVPLRFASLARLNHRPAAVVQALERAYQFEPWRGELLEEIGVNAFRAGDTAKALEAFERAVAGNQMSPFSQYVMGEAYLAGGETIKALAIWEGLMNSPLAPLEVFDALYQTQYRFENYEGALLTLSRWVERQPERAELNYQLGLFLSVQSPEKAAAYLQRASQADEAYRSKTDKLIAALDQALAVHEISRRKRMIGQTLGSLGEWRLAKWAFAQAVQQSPADADNWAYLAEAKAQLKQGGSEELAEAMKRDARSVVVQGVAALQRRREGKPELALVNYYALAAREPENGIWQIEIGNTLSEMGDIHAALRHFERATQIEPQNPLTWLALSEFCVTHGLAVRTVGLPAARQVLALSPNDPVGLDVLGKSLYFLGDILGSERVFLSALRVDPGLAVAHLDLGKLYLQNGNRNAAWYHLTEAHQLSADGSPVRIMAERILERYYP